ncbi:hypothetical protein C1645_822578 [Glomus cerebriforme]|uniref:Crinkler effector protein N-terminal domain-containing protein n=1 Tax=Glomus cerebriforme TaxID=658196 RepID=A0A397T7K4_9GLOM|nr:hypothetical protein C1645_822578 [Glomus cerebriforme]
MDQSSGSSVQTEIFPPENIRLHTKYTKRSLFNILLKREISAQRSLFAVSITNEITLSSQLRNAIYKIKENTFTNIDENNLILWKVNIPINKENMSKLDEAFCSSREVNIRRDFGGEELFSADEIPEDYRNQQPPEDPEQYMNR